MIVPSLAKAMGQSVHLLKYKKRWLHLQEKRILSKHVRDQDRGARRHKKAREERHPPESPDRESPITRVVEARK